MSYSDNVWGMNSADSLKSLQHQYLKKASKFEREKDYYNAIYYYQAYFKKGGTKIKPTYKLGLLYFLTRNYSKAEIYFDKLITSKESKDSRVYYYKGIICLNLEKYDEAIRCFEEFRKEYKGHRDPEGLRQLAGDFIESSIWAKAHKDSIQNISITSLGPDINKPHIEFSPFPLSDKSLLFGSYIADSVKNSMNLRKIYAAEKVNKQWTTTGEFDKTINSTEFHTGNPVITSDGKKIYFTRCQENWKKEMICEIFVSELTDNEWTQPVKLPYPINDDNYTTTQPALGKNTKNGADILYFVSDRPGGKGGLDIWFTQFDRRSNQFQEPRNAGNKINTKADECCPFYDVTNRTLYFSSQGQKTFGGYDIYKISGSNRSWSDVLSLPKPINSSYDDTYYSTIKNGEEGFFTSNRPGSDTLLNGSCCDDIFYFHFNECTKISVSGKVFNVTNYDVYDELNRKFNLKIEYPANRAPVQGISIDLFKLESKTNEASLISQVTTDTKGIFNFSVDLNQEYRIVVRNYGFFDKVVNFSTNNKNCEDSIDLGISQINVLPELTVRFNVYYEHDKARLTRDAQTVIDTTLLSVFDLFPNAVIEIGSHTDNTGSDNYNLKLSQKRSESVVNYLISKGISADRLVARGYGESQPIASNSNPDGTDNPEGRQLNRRTELKIVGELNTFLHDE